MGFRSLREQILLRGVPLKNTVKRKLMIWAEHNYEPCKTAELIKMILGRTLRPKRPLLDRVALIPPGACVGSICAEAAMRSVATITVATYHQLLCSMP